MFKRITSMAVDSYPFRLLVTLIINHLVRFKITYNLLKLHLVCVTFRYREIKKHI